MEESRRRQLLPSSFKAMAGTWPQAWAKRGLFVERRRRQLQHGARRHMRLLRQRGLQERLGVLVLRVQFEHLAARLLGAVVVLAHVHQHAAEVDVSIRVLRLEFASQLCALVLGGTRPEHLKIKTTSGSSVAELIK